MPKLPMTRQEAAKRLEAAARRAPAKAGVLRGPRPAQAVRPSLLTWSEKERLKNRIRADEDLLRQCRGQDTEGVGDVFLPPTQAYSAFNVGFVERRLKRNKLAMERMDPANHRFTGAERDRADKRRRELEAKMSKLMLSTYEMGYYPGRKKDTDLNDSRYREACEKSFKQEVGNPEFQRMAQEHKELCRRLDPDNPGLANIERLRSRRRY